MWVVGKGHSEYGDIRARILSEGGSHADAREEQCVQKLLFGLF